MEDVHKNKRKNVLAIISHCNSPTSKRRENLLGDLESEIKVKYSKIIRKIHFKCFKLANFSLESTL